MIEVVKKTTPTSLAATEQPQQSLQECKFICGRFISYHYPGSGRMIQEVKRETTYQHFIVVHGYIFFSGEPFPEVFFSGRFFRYA